MAETCQVSPDIVEKLHSGQAIGGFPPVFQMPDQMGFRKRGEGRLMTAKAKSMNRRVRRVTQRKDKKGDKHAVV